jgi:protein SCO1/2
VTAGAQSPGKDAARQVTESRARASEKGLFVLEPIVSANGLRIGTNSVDIMLRDRSGKSVEGAKLVVTPWSADMGYGVWEKPLVLEKGNGVYHVENISIIRSGRWELKVAIKSGAKEDQSVVAYTVAQKEKLPPPKQAKTKGGYSRTVKQYTIPNMTLLNQDGKRVNLKALTESGKPVIVNFIYTTCTTICPVLSASFSNLRKELGPDLERVQFISISIDPEHDRPEQMKKYLARFTSKKGWDFLTGSREEINRVLKAFDATITDKMSHEPLYLLHGPQSDDWVRIKGLTWSADLMNELRSVEN